MYSKAMFAKQFKELIDKRGLTQRAVAERINTTETTISRYVSGDRTLNNVHADILHNFYRFLFVHNRKAAHYAFGLLSSISLSSGGSAMGYVVKEGGTTL